MDPPHAGPQVRADFDEFDEAFVRCYPNAHRAAMGLVIGALPRVKDGEVLEGEDAFKYMVELRQRMVDAATEAATPYDSETWLILIRRLSPRALSHAESGTMDYEGDSTERVAENLVGAARGEHLDVESAPVPTVVSMRLARLFALAGMVDSLESAVRSATKGVKYRVRRRHRPRPFDSDALRASLREFDLRSSWKSADDAPRLESITSDDFEGDPPMLVAYRFKDGLGIDQTWDGPFRAADPVEDTVRFTIRAFTTGDETYTVLGRHGVLASFEDPAATASLIVFGNALLRHVLDVDDAAGATLPRRGLLRIETEVLTAVINDTLHSEAIAVWLTENGQAALSASAVLASIRSLYVHGRRSLPGPVIQTSGDQTLVDAWAYACHVTDDLKLSPHTGGAIANLSAAQFESATQSLIDASVLAPLPKLRKLRGKTLRLNGKAVTDIDAILVADKTKLFLISCKNYLIRIDYLAGEYRAARSGRQRLDAALDEWKDRVATFRNSPVGDNYDFSGYEIEGFIVLPELIFTPRSDSRQTLHFGSADLFFTKVESYSQLAATLEMASWPPEPLALRALRTSGQ
ncbi:hypothetical protein GCM10009588_03430 [Microbacterium phyllosphaerae]